MIRQKQNFLSANRLLLIASETFFDSSVVPLFLVIGKLGERTGQLWRNNSRCVRAHEKNSGDAVRRLGTIIQSIFCAQSGASIRLTVWKWSGESRYPGAFPPVLETFVAIFLPARLTAPGSPRMERSFFDVISSLNTKFFQIWSSVTGYGELNVCF